MLPFYDNPCADGVIMWLNVCMKSQNLPGQDEVFSLRYCWHGVFQNFVLSIHKNHSIYDGFFLRKASLVLSTNRYILCR